MSLRRKSCNHCFKSRRKCDFTYPTCGTCRRTRKTCQYAYAPTRRSNESWQPESLSTGRVLSSTSSTTPTLAQVQNDPISTLLEIDAFTSCVFSQYEESLDFGSISSPSQSVLDPLTNTPPTRSSVPDLVGPLGEVQPLQGGTESWQWVIEQFKGYPREFAQRAETLFIHKELYSESMPQPIRAAFGVSSASCFINANNAAMLFKMIDSEILELLNRVDGATLLEELASLQAAVLYQIIRLFHGSIEQRVVAEQQQDVLMTWSLKFLARSKIELGNSAATDRQTWILAESIRRTVLMVYMLYGVNSIFKQGICIGFPTLAKLPVSTALGSWNSQIDDEYRFQTDATISYETFTALWLVSTPRSLDPFEKLLLIPCKGIDIVTTYNQSALSAI